MFFGWFVAGYLVVICFQLAVTAFCGRVLRGCVVRRWGGFALDVFVFGVYLGVGLFRGWC